MGSSKCQEASGSRFSAEDTLHVRQSIIHFGIFGPNAQGRHAGTVLAHYRLWSCQGLTRRAQSPFMVCAHPFSSLDEDGCASSAGAVPGSFPFIVKYLFVFAAGIGALMFVRVQLWVDAFRGHWMDFRWRLRSIARSLQTLMSLRRSITSSPLLRVG